MFQMDGGEDVPAGRRMKRDGPDERQDQDSDDDGGGWITGNIKQIQQEMKQCAVPQGRAGRLCDHRLLPCRWWSGYLLAWAQCHILRDSGPSEVGDGMCGTVI